MTGGPRVVVVLGSSGFVGAAVVAALEDRGHHVRRVHAPRISAGTVDEGSVTADLMDVLSGADAVVNAAGLPDAAGGDLDALRGANSILPGLVAQAAHTGGQRMVHISSAAVQGARSALDSGEETTPFSPYSQSKAEGEQAALSAGRGSTVIYRPPGVHGAERRLTGSIARLARSPLASVAGRGDRMTANALVTNVGDAVAFLSTTASRPPHIVHHPSEGITTAALLRALGGREPRHIPEFAARSALLMARRAARVRPPLLAHVRRMEMLWFGQEQAPSWLTEAGWTPVHGLDHWERLGRDLRQDDGEEGR